MSDRTGNFMFTFNGQKYWPMDPRPSDVHIEVIAHHLANQCRYNGAVRHSSNPRRIFYSVAEHSVYVARHVELELGRPDLALEALLHDAAEAYLGDLIRPLKYDDAFREPYKRVEELNERAIAEAFGLVYPFPKEVHWADEAVTTAEVQQIIAEEPSVSFEEGYLHNGQVCAPVTIYMHDPFNAKTMFLAEFRRLVRMRKAREKTKAVPTSVVL